MGAVNNEFFVIQEVTASLVIGEVPHLWPKISLYTATHISSYMYTVYKSSEYYMMFIWNNAFMGTKIEIA